ncbi:MAG: histidine phosphatase family protein [Candidatus Micrarchaeota archaeon]|nr:histidine phosphatase family protein [Candidatus Micrarchaeota archaeon]
MKANSGNEGSAAKNGKLPNAQLRRGRTDGVTVLYITRHAVTAPNQEDLVQGRRYDSEISDAGKLQSEELAVELLRHKIDVAYCSSMRRCRQSIMPYKNSAGIKVNYVKDLEERDYGVFDGRPGSEYREWIRRNGFEGNYSFRPPGGETFQDLRARARAVMREILARHGGEAILIMAHCATGVAIMLNLFNEREEGNYVKYMLKNCALSVVEIRYGRPHLELLNSTAHLKNTESTGKARSPTP